MANHTLHTRKRRLTDALRPAVVLAAVLLTVAPPHAAASDLNRIVLRVNDQIATLYDFQARRADAIAEVMRRVKDSKEQKDELSQVSENVFRDMFQELLLSSRADQLGVDATDQEVDDRIQAIKKNFGIKTEADFQQALAQNGMTVEQLRTMTRRTLRMQGVIQKEVQSKIKVKDEDLRRYYRAHEADYRVAEQVQLREVVVLDEGGLAAADRAHVAAQIRAAVTGGKSLQDAVAPFAAKNQTSSVVDLGWVSPKDLDSKLEAVAWKLPKDGISDPVEGRGGLHLLQLVDRHPAHVKAFSAVQAQIQQLEQERLFREESIKYMGDLEQRSLVVADPPKEAANFRRKIGVTDETAQKDLKGAAATPTAAPPEAGSPGAPVTPGAAVTPTSGAIDTVVTSGTPVVDTAEKKKNQGGLPAPQPAGTQPAQSDAITIPPPPPAPAPPPAH